MPTKRISPSAPRAKAGPRAPAAVAEPAVTPLFQPVRTRRTFEAVSSQIREQLARGELRPGDRLPGGAGPSNENPDSCSPPVENPRSSS